MATVSSGTASERFGFVERYRSELGTQFLCDWLGVSRSGFYAWKTRKPSNRAKSDQALLKVIKRIFDKSKGRYGSPRVHIALKKQGISVGRSRVERLMRQAGLKGRVSRVTRRMPGLKRFIAQGENKLLEHGNATQINQVWVSDITYIKHQNSWWYLVTIMDQYSRRILGWTLSKSRTAEVTAKVLQAAIKNRGYPKGIIFHTDRGIEFTGSDFQKVLKKYEFIHSVNRIGYCTDNAFMESFYHSLKGELIRKSKFKSPAHLRKEIGRYINQFYNLVRLHSGLSYMSPIKYEQSLG